MPGLFERAIVARILGTCLFFCSLTIDLANFQKYEFTFIGERLDDKEVLFVFLTFSFGDSSVFDVCRSQ
jgi:hypothetical protein